nr:hypothetical protein [Lysinibacillus sphaericus]
MDSKVFEFRKEFIEKVNEAPPDGYFLMHLGLEKQCSKVFDTVFKDLQRGYKLPNVKFKVNSGFYKEDGIVREAWNDYKTDEISIFIESIFYTFCVNTTQYNSGDEEDKLEWLTLMVNTLAHEYYHSIQKSNGVNMSKPNKSIEKDANDFSENFTKKFIKKNLDQQAGNES